MGTGSQTQGPLSCDVSTLSPRGDIFSGPLGLNANASSSVLKKQHSRVACFCASAQMKLPLMTPRVTWLYCGSFWAEAEGTNKDSQALMEWNKVSVLTMMIWDISLEHVSGCMRCSGRLKNMYITISRKTQTGTGDPHREGWKTFKLSN